MSFEKLAFTFTVVQNGAQRNEVRLPTRPESRKSCREGIDQGVCAFYVPDYHVANAAQKFLCEVFLF